jgi:hypothetical protein
MENKKSFKSSEEILQYYMPKMKERMSLKNTEASKLRDTEFKAREMAREVLATLKSEIKKVQLEETAEQVEATTEEVAAESTETQQEEIASPAEETPSVQQTVMNRKRGLFRYRR